MSKVRRRDLTSSFAALAAKCEERRNLNCDFGDEQGQDKDRILPRFGLEFHHTDLSHLTTPQDVYRNEFDNRIVISLLPYILRTN